MRMYLAVLLTFFPVMPVAAALFADDVERVTVIRPELVPGLPEKGKDIIVIGNGSITDVLVGRHTCGKKKKRCISGRLNMPLPDRLV